MFGLRKLQKRPVAAPAEVAGIRVKASARARRLTLRLDAKEGDIVLVWPRGMTEGKAARFVERNRDWIEQHRRKAVPRRTFTAGDVISVYGRAFTITRREGRGIAALEEDRLVIHCRPEHLHRRVKDFLKEAARDVLAELAAQKQDRLSLQPKEIRVVDPRTRWGSCSHDGRLMFSWRLILAPPAVLDYLVAHEVAHRLHMNHGRKFWTLCASLTEDAAAARRWLRKNGNLLMAYN